MFVPLIAFSFFSLAAAETSASKLRPMTARLVVKGERLKWLSELSDLNLGQLVSEPQITIPELLLSRENWPSSLRSQEDFAKVEPLFKLIESEDFDKAYIDAERVIKKWARGPSSSAPHSAQEEWVRLLKADIYFQVQNRRGEPQWSMVLEEYQDFARDYPLHPESVRLLYQIALIQLRMKFFRDCDQTIQRALKQFPDTDLDPYFHLVWGEQAFLAGDDAKANFEFSYIIRKYPHHSTSADAAYRKAFILFRAGQFAEALDVYESLERLHSDHYAKLKAGRASQTKDRLIDRVLYAESVYLNYKYREAARLFQDLANIFPQSAEAPFLFLRLADTYLRRNSVSAALEIYRDVIKRYDKEVRALVLAHLRLADGFFVSDTLNAQRFSEEHYLQAYDIAKSAKDETMMAFSLVKLAAFHFFNGTYPKAQSVLRTYREQFPQGAHKDWVEKQLGRTVEIEIQDYYRREDYLAALSTYLGLEKDNAHFFKDTRVLMTLADSARRLGLLDSATSILNRVVYLDRSSLGRQEALLELVDLSISKNELKKASERLRRFKFAYPKSPSVVRVEELWGDLYAKLGNSEGAIGHYEKALRLVKADAKAAYEKRFIYLRLADLYQAQSLPLKAIEAFERYLQWVNEKRKSEFTKDEVTRKDDYLYRTTRYRIADMYFEMKDFVRAVEAYSKAAEEIKDEPLQSHALYRMGECYLALDDRKAALSVFERLVKKDTKSLWLTAAKSYIDTVSMEVKYGVRIVN